MKSGRIAPFGVLGALVLAAACSSSSNGGGGGGKPDSGAEGGADASEDTSADTGGGSDTGPQQDASEGGSTTDSPSDASGGDGGLCDLGSSLVLWLEGDMGLTSSGNMVTWTDQSPAMNNASSGSGQANPPTIDSMVVNGHTAVKFDGTNTLAVQDAASVQWGTGSFAVMLVMSDTTNTADAGANSAFPIVSKLGPAASGSIGFALQLYPGGLEGSDYQSRQVRATSTAIADGKFHVVGAIRSGGVLQLRIDGASAATGAFATDVSESGQVVALGSSPSLGPPAFAGDIAEVIAVKGALADPTCLESYLKAKYGL